MAAGADLDRVTILESVRYLAQDGKTRIRSFCLEDLPQLAEAIANANDPSLVVIDPVRRRAEISHTTISCSKPPRSTTGESSPKNRNDLRHNSRHKPPSSADRLCQEIFLHHTARAIGPFSLAQITPPKIIRFVPKNHTYKHLS